MKTAAVIIEKWKLAIFTRHLREAGFAYDTDEGITNDTYTLKVSYESVEKLKPVILAATQECYLKKPK